jgi:EmrB/QacA subfamily drug resistance transporter
MVDSEEKITCDVPPYGVATGGEAADDFTGPVVSDSTGRWVLFSTILASSMVFIDSSVLNVALPALQADLDASGAQLLWIMNAYLVMLAAFILVGGSAGDVLGRRKVFMSGITLFLAGSLLAGLAPDAGMLIGARVVQGIGGALMIPGSLSIITAFFNEEHRGRAIGTWAAVTAGVTVFGPIIGGSLADAGLWRGVFLINIPIGVVALISLYYRVPESRDQDSGRRIDYPGGLLAAVGLACVTYGFLSAPGSGFHHPQVSATLAVGFISLGLFAIVQMKSSHPMVPLGIFRNRIFSGANLITLFLYGALSVFVFFLALNLVQIQGYSPTLAGLTFLPFAVLLAGLSRWAGSLADSVGARPLIVIGTLVTAGALVQMSTIGVTAGPSDFWTTFFPGIFLFGIGLGLTVTPLTTTVMGALDTHLAGTASGVNNAVSRTASVFATAIIGSLALMAFTGALEDRAAALDLPLQARADLREEAARLGDAAVPASVPGAEVQRVDREIDEGFVYAFRVVLFIAAGMTFTSTVIATALLGPEREAKA